MRRDNAPEQGFNTEKLYYDKGHGYVLTDEFLCVTFIPHIKS